MIQEKSEELGSFVEKLKQIIHDKEHE